MDKPTFPFLVVFYSFKGGVGRTLALLNTAIIIAQSGRKVLMIDADLEAPGLTLIHKDRLSEKPGFMELLGDIITDLDAHIRRAERKQIALRPYVEDVSSACGGRVVVCRSSRLAVLISTLHRWQSCGCGKFTQLAPGLRFQRP